VKTTTKTRPKPTAGVAPVRVVIADDHPLYRDALSRAVSWHPQLELIGEASDGPAALALIETLEPEVAVLDLHMPRLSGLQICARLEHADPPIRTAVLIVSAFLSTELFSEAVRCGAAGYIGKDAARDELADAIVTVGTGGRAFADWGGPASLWPVPGRAGTNAP
jgi:two-component system nitrate/nitrite response regulator NarL